MRLGKPLRALMCAALLSLAGLVTVRTVVAQQQAQQAGAAGRQSIQGQQVPADRLDITATSSQTGFATFATAPGEGILLSIGAGASAEARARSFINDYGGAFGLNTGSQVRLLKVPERDELGVEHVRMQQMHLDIPIRAAEFVVHLRGNRAVAANGRVVSDFPSSVTPTIPAAEAGLASRRMLEKQRRASVTVATYSEPQLEVLNRSLLSGVGSDQSRLAWFVRASGPGLNEYIWIDANTGVVLLNFNQLPTSKSRAIYTANQTSVLPGTLVRSEGGPATGDADQDNAYFYTGLTYDYFFTNHGRDSFNNAGGTLVSTTHFFHPDICPNNAFWYANQMVFCDDAASADDVVAHELTHAVVEYSADLLYYRQSGALNESFADIFGETVDLTNGAGNDDSDVRWLMGEDFPSGSIRDLMTPQSFGHPGKMSDPEFACWPADDNGDDQGGVHTNSGVPNHAYALMVDGGTYNGRTVSGIGLAKAAKIQYRALTTYLTSGATFIDAYSALNQSCSDLIGTSGISADDCAEVTQALQAVEMDKAWTCSLLATPPALCPSGSVSTTSIDTFEAGNGNWVATNDAGEWNRTTSFPKSGSYSQNGTGSNTTSDHRLTMINAVTIPSGGRLYFDHLFEFEYGAFSDYDGGVLEYSTNNGTTWTDAALLIDAGWAYNGGPISANALTGRPGFVRSTNGYHVGTRLNLSSLAGQNVKFRFRVGTDVTVGTLGWFVDNVRIYSCAGATGSTAVSVVDSNRKLLTVDVSTGTATVLGTSAVELFDIAFTSSGTLWGIGADNNLYSVNASTGALSFIGNLGVTGLNALVGNGAGLLAASGNDGSLYSVNTSTGAATPLVGNMGYVSAGDLAFHNGSLYATVLNGAFSDLVRIDLAGGSFTATHLGHVTADNDLFGLVSAADGNLYGIDGTTVIQIDPSDPGASSIAVSNYAAGVAGLGQANGAATAVSPVPPPGAFGKTLPADGGPLQPMTVVLTWGPSSAATGYEYCLDTSNNNVCNQLWVPIGTATSTTVTGLLENTTYYWHVRASNTGGTTYSDGSPTAFRAFTTRRSVLTDLNGDGLGDVLTYHPGTGDWARYLSQPGGGFSQENSGVWASGWSVLRADFNQDHLTDFFLFNTTSGAWAKMLNDGIGFTTQATGSWWPGWQRYAMDLDGDGLTDFFLYDPATGTWFKCVSTPGGFNYVQGGWNPNWEIYSITLNSDALGDMFLIDRATGRWFWVYGQAGAGFSYPATGVWFPGWQLYPGDFNGDGLADILLHDPATGHYFVSTNTGSGFSYVQGGWSLGWQPYVADFNRDAKDDLFLHDPSTGVWFEMFSDGLGNFVNAGGQIWSLGWSLFPTDLDNDGRADMVLYHPSSGVWYQALNLLDGSFSYSSGTWAAGLTLVMRSPIR